MKKLRIKIVCAILAFCMLMSGTVSVFAADPTYTAKYDWKASKEVYSAIIDDLDKILADAAFNGNTVQELWKIVPGLSGVLEGTDSADFYADALDDLADYMNENSIETVTADVLDSYFAQYPYKVDSPSDFADALKTFVSTLMTKGSMVMLGGTGLYSVLLTVIAFGSDGGMNEELLNAFFSSFDNISKALGVEQDQTFEEAFDLIDQSPEAPQNVANYVNNIVNALIPNTVDNVTAVLQRLMIPEYSALLFNGLSDLFVSLETILINVQPVLGGFGFDLSPIQDIVIKIKNYVVGIPTNEDRSIDWNAALSYIINQIILPELAGINLNAVSFGEGGNGILKFSAVNPDNLAQAADTTDALNVAMHYLYDNINANNSTIDTLIEIILPPLNVTLPQEVTDILDMVTTNTESDAVWNIYSMLHVAAGYEAPVMPEDPNTPTDPSNPSDPSDPTPDDPSNTDKPSDNGGNKMDDGSKTTVNNKNTANPKLPNTGAEEMSALFVIIPIAAAAAFLLVVTLRKRVIENR